MSTIESDWKNLKIAFYISTTCNAKRTKMRERRRALYFVQSCTINEPTAVAIAGGLSKGTSVIFDVSILNICGNVCEVKET